MREYWGKQRNLIRQRMKIKNQSAPQSTQLIEANSSSQVVRNKKRFSDLSKIWISKLNTTVDNTKTQKMEVEEKHENDLFA